VTLEPLKGRGQMAEKNVNVKDSVAVIDEIETKLEGLLNKRKDEIEKER